jgi:CP family cyanate transporter-like MFS transporter
VRADLGLSAGLAGLLTTLPLIAFGVLAPAAPWLARRVSLERLLTICVAVTGVGAAVRAVGGVGGLFLGSCLAGAAVAIAQAALPVLIRVGYPEQMGKLIGAFSMALSVGSALPGAVAVPLADLFGGSWAASLATWALPAALAALIWAPAAAARGTFVTGPRAQSLYREPLAWAVAGYFGMQSIGFYAGLAWIPEILQAEGWSSAAAGNLLALSYVVGTFPAWLVPIIAARRRSQRGQLAWTVVLAFAGILGLLTAPGLALVWMVLIGLGQGGTLGLALILPVLRAREPGAIAAMTAMMFSVGYLVAALGPWVVGTVHDLTGGWTAALVTLLVLTLLQLVPGLPATRDRYVASPGAG